VRTGNVGICRFAGGYAMRGKIIIRIRRKNEFNGYWTFLITTSILFGILSLTVKTANEVILILFVFSVIIILATLYQGFEIIKE
jgi:hypothetical protein